MAKVQGRRGGRGRGRVSFAHGTSRNNNNKNTVAPNARHSISVPGGSQGKSHAEKLKGKPILKKSNKRRAHSDAHTHAGGGLENDLDHILSADTLAKHIDPPFTELEDDFSRLKTQCIQSATLVLHLQNKLESDQPKHKRAHPPEAIAIGGELQPDLSKADNIKTTTVRAHPINDTQRPANSPHSIIYSSISKSWSGKRSSIKPPKFPIIPQSPVTALWAGSPMSVQMASPSSTQLTPTLNRLLDELHDAIQSRDGDRIALDLQIEPPLAQAYNDLSLELRKHYPWGKDRHLPTLCEKVLPKGPDGVRNAWESFAGHLLQYLQWLRDFPSDNLLKNNNDLKRLLNTSCICLGDTTFGVLILPSVLYLSKVLANFAIGLDKRPELVAQLLNEQSIGNHERIKDKATFVEDAANTIREAFIKCLSDKSGSGGFGKHAAPEGKRTGIYKTGNLCLKLLFQCRKLSSANTMFVSIDAQSPLLSHYPASQRVTYLYYLGRYLFANNHFFRAQLALQAAYDQCHAQALRHRQLILVYLIASNVCLGRFPSSKLLLRREAAELANHFLPLCRLIASGNLAGFRSYLSLDNGHGQWFLQKRLLFQLRNRCEPLVWRSLARRVFIEVGFPGGEDNKTPFLRLYLLQTAAHWLDKRYARPALQETAVNSQSRHPSSRNSDEVELDTENRVPEECDSEFEGMENAIEETGFDVEAGAYNGSREHRRQGSVTAQLASQRVHPTMEEVESIMASLIQQDLIYGFLTHNNPRFAIPGAKTKGALAVGFPRVWEVIEARKRGTGVPGWVKEDDTPNIFGAGSLGGSGGGGRVVRLSGARAVGAGAA